jgi:hypothetical protein
MRPANPTDATKPLIKVKVSGPLSVGYAAR